jgi:hypothetical protein
MRTTLNLSDGIVHEAESLYQTSNRSKAVECAIVDAIRFHKLKALMALKGKLLFDEAFLEEQREAELHETDDTP